MAEQKTSLRDQRVTIMLSPLLNKEIRRRQAQYIQKNQCTYSFSSAIQDIIRKGLG